ncbi:Rhomboid family protein [Dokdonella immobilis]|uniref:Rhomboid family protein n=2 Tax=Dokdonella immobilis TaxID=578942 RepID=A0A1I4XL16_9GAMM|nr:Rhomboid family protein [Dokdonella immobilis]
MLIMPLHRRMTMANAPLVTLTLILLNCAVYFFLQSGDDRVLQQALDYYQKSELGKIEFPAYSDWLRDHVGDDDAEQRLEAMQGAPPELKLALIESDPIFLEALRADQIIDPGHQGHAEWRAKRTEFDRIRDSTFTSGHALRFSNVEPGRMAWAMFMHGGLEHLVGNMLFLLILGLLVEGALGPWWYLGLYIAGGFGASFATVAWHWGDQGLALGASGAIAALMGAYCVIWSRRRVRVFYWFFVVFDYVRVPALVLLPFWLGWEVLNLWLSGDTQIGFDAHAGGIVCGAGIALLLRRLGVVRNDFVEEDEREEKRDGHALAYAKALEQIGKLEVSRARALLENIEAEEPGQLHVLTALYRCARYGGTADQLDAAATRVLSFPAKDESTIGELRTVWTDYLKVCAGAPRIAPPLMLRLLNPLLRIGADADAEALLHAIARTHPKLPALASAWFAFSLRAPEASPQRRQRLEYLARHFSDSEFAPKARFLLQQNA